MIIKKLIGRNASLLILLLSLVTCDNYTFPESPYSRVKTLEVMRSNDGVILRADIFSLGDYPILNHGFVWNDNGALVGLLIGEVIELGPTAKTGIYQAEIKGLTMGKEYWFRALLNGEEHEVRGNVISFKFE
jgi:hypothetical protein